MRKKIVAENHDVPESGLKNDWLDLERLAEVEVTSEEPGYPIERALVPGAGTGGWRAAAGGMQRVRLSFDEPQKVSCIMLDFVEKERSRTQEFVVRWCAEGETQWRDIVRQQYNFNPGGSANEREDVHVALSGVKGLELEVIPDISGGDACATLLSMRVAG